MAQGPIAQTTARKAFTRLANRALGLWEASDGGRAKLINVSENFTFRVEVSDQAGGTRRSVLRLHRAGYHSRDAIASELAWLDALHDAAVIPTPRPLLGKDGAAIQLAHAPELRAPRFLVLFEHIDGGPPDEAGALTELFSHLGGLAAKCHTHALNWTRPDRFERMSWDTEAIFGPHPVWGDWRDAPGVDATIRAVLNRVEGALTARLAAYGRRADRFNLIHADMRLANVILSPDGPRLIDFDDCGFGWLMYDFAASVSFMEDDPRLPEWKAAWLKGYQSLRPLSPADLAEIDTFVMLRRMALLAWIGSHIDAPEPQELAPGFAATTARLGQAWLDGMPR